MRTLRLYSKPIVLVMICVFLSITSFGSQVNLGAKTKANANISSTMTPATGVPALTVPAAAVIAAGVALYASAVVSSYELGTIVGHAMYDLFGGESYLVPVVPEKYDSSDFSKFDS